MKKEAFFIIFLLIALAPSISSQISQEELINPLENPRPSEPREEIINPLGEIEILDPVNSPKGYIIQFEEEPILKKQKSLQDAAEKNEQSPARGIYRAASVFLPRELEPANSENLQAKIEDHNHKVNREHAQAKAKIQNKLYSSSLTGRASGSPEPLQILSENQFLFNGITLDISEEAAESLKSLPEVKEVYPNLPIFLDLTDAVPLIQANALAGKLDEDGNNCDVSGNPCLTGSGVTISIIDSGIDYTHQSLGDCFGPGCKVSGGYDLINDDSDPMDDFGHGTHVAGIAAGNGDWDNNGIIEETEGLSGAAPGANLLAFKIFNSAGATTYNALLDSIERSYDINNNECIWIGPEDQGVDFSGNPCTEPLGLEDRADIISMSLGSKCGGVYDQSCGPEDSISQAVNDAVDSGVVVVISAGNSGPDERTIGSPGTAEKVITIGASTDEDEITSFSSRGPVSWVSQGESKVLLKPDIVAPGNLISASCMGGESCIKSGTSMSAPLVSGSIALIKQVHPDWTPEEIKTALKDTSLDIGENILSQGIGRLQVKEALNYENPLTVTLESETQGNSLQIIISTENPTSEAFSLDYQKASAEETWNILETGTISPGSQETTFNYDLTSFNNGIILFRLSIGNLQRYISINVDNFKITKIGNEISYLTDQEKSVHIEVNNGDYHSYEIYARKATDHPFVEEYGPWNLILTSPESLISGATSLDLNNLEGDGKYQFKIRAISSEGHETESEVSERTIYLSFLKDGLVSKTIYSEPKEIILRKNSNDEKEIILFTSNRLTNQYKGIIEIWKNNEVQIINTLSKKSSSYPFSVNGIRLLSHFQNNLLLEAHYRDYGNYFGLFDYKTTSYVFNWPYDEDLNINTFTVQPIITGSKIILFGEIWSRETAYTGIYKFLVLNSEGDLLYEKIVSEVEPGSFTTPTIIMPILSILEEGNTKKLIYIESPFQHPPEEIGESLLKIKVYDLDTGELLNENEILNEEAQRVERVGNKPITIVSEGTSKLLLPIQKKEGSLRHTYFYLINSNGEVEQRISLENNYFTISGALQERSLALEYQGEPHFANIVWDKSIFKHKILLTSFNGQHSEIILGSLTDIDVFRAADINNDGDPEFITANSPPSYDGADSKIYFFNSQGEIIKKIRLPTQEGVDIPRDLVITDYDDDGNTDLILTTHSREACSGSCLNNLRGKLLVLDLGSDFPYNEEKMYWPVHEGNFRRTNCFGCTSEEIDTNPIVTITSPESTYYSEPPTTLTYIYQDSSEGVCWYSTDSGVTNSPEQEAGTPFENLPLDETQEGLNTWTIFCRDSSGNEGSESIEFTLDTTPPRFIDPIENQFLEEGDSLNYPIRVTDDGVGMNNEPITINWEHTFELEQNLWHNDPETGQSIVRDKIINTAEIPEGIHEIEITITDSLEHSHSEILTITKISNDPNPPIVTVTYPEQIAYATPPTSIEYNYQDESHGVCWYSTDSGVTNSPEQEAGTPFENLPLDETQEGLNTWTIFCRDSSGNEGSESVIFILDTIPPEFNPPLEDQILQEGDSLSYLVLAIDSRTTVESYSINPSEIFEIESTTGLLTSISEIPEGIHEIEITITDSAGNSYSEILTVTLLLENLIPPPEERHYSLNENEQVSEDQNLDNYITETEFTSYVQAWTSGSTFQGNKINQLEITHSAYRWATRAELIPEEPEDPNTPLILSGSITPEPTLDLVTGWNAISFPLQEDFSVQNLHDLCPIQSTVEWDPVTQQNSFLSASNLLESGKGYSIFSLSDCTIDFVSEGYTLNNQIEITLHPGWNKVAGISGSTQEFFPPEASPIYNIEAVTQRNIPAILSDPYQALWIYYTPA